MSKEVNKSFTYTKPKINEEHLQRNSIQQENTDFLEKCLEKIIKANQVNHVLAKYSNDDLKNVYQKEVKVINNLKARFNLVTTQINNTSLKIREGKRSFTYNLTKKSINLSKNVSRNDNAKVNNLSSEKSHSSISNSSKCSNKKSSNNSKTSSENSCLKLVKQKTIQTINFDYIDFDNCLDNYPSFMSSKKRSKYL